ncbi:hypothetical protein [Burkholderia sp. BCC1977]|uniref:hypothetical protein n=1 Tax=Burkholderia sp. BCC1977 TaxID=2817440 RepID=UPI002ABDCD3C|nr:hypothetical protein [Burkholderia sp. BCC1977]
MQNPVALLAFALIFAAPVAHAGRTDKAGCTTGTIPAIRQQALSESHAAGRAKGAAARAAYDTLKPAVDASCLSATDNEAALVNAMAPGAITYAWLLNDASTYLIAAGSDNNASQSDADSPARLDVLQTLIHDDLRPRTWLPHRLRVAVAASVQRCSARCVWPSCKPTNMNVRATYRSEAALYTRHPSCRFDARLVQLSADTHFALMGEGLDCFGGTACSLVEAIYVPRKGRPVLGRNNSADF